MATSDYVSTSSPRIKVTKRGAIGHRFGILMGATMLGSSVPSTLVRAFSLAVSYLLGLGALLLWVAPPAAAAPTTYTVNSSSTASPGAPNGICDVDVASGIQCNLRDAINESNANAGRDTIAFDTAAFANPYVVGVSASSLPAITDAVTIDGTTQPGYNPATGVVVRLDGPSSRAPNGLTIMPAGSGSIVTGLAFTRFNEAVRLEGSNNLLTGNFFGLQSTGTAINLYNTTSVHVYGGNANVIGGTTSTEANVVGFGNDGIRVTGTDPSGLPTVGNADGNQILGNYIGLRKDGVTAAAAGYGVALNVATNTTIGSVAGRNVIAANSYNISTGNSVDTSVVGNYIGTNAAGTSAVGTPYMGIELGYNSSAVVTDNLISGNTYGVYSCCSGLDVTLTDNLIGTNASATARVANTYGVVLTSYAELGRVELSGNRISGNDYIGVQLYGPDVTVHDNIIGAASPSEATANLGNSYTGLQVSGAQRGAITDNTISGNGGNGGDVSGSRNLKISGNQFGTDEAGSVAVPNYGSGLNVCDAHDLNIGGLSAGDANVMSGNFSDGLSVTCDSAENLVRGNLIGVGSDATTSIPNGGHGVSMRNADRNAVGGAAPGAGNVIASNSVSGVAVDLQAQGNLIWGNSIRNNGVLGIDLQEDYAVTLNDPGDGDGGGNARQNYPVLTQAASDGSVTVVKGNLSSRPLRDYRVEFFASSSCDSSGYGEGERYLGFVTVTTNSTGTRNFNGHLPTAAIGAGEQVTATATDIRREDTSEFSACMEAIGLPTAAIDDVSVTEGDSGSTNADFTVSLSAPPTVPATVRARTIAGTATSPADFASVNTTLTFAVGETTKTVSVPIAGDTADEFDESYTVLLDRPDNMTIADDTGQGTVIDDDQQPTLSFADVTVNEPTSGSESAQVVFQLSAASGKPVTFSFATANGTANTKDYSPRGFSVTIAPGATTRTVNIPIKADVFDEPDQTFFVDVTSPVNVTVPDPQAVVTIVDSDATPELNINDSSVLEGDSGTQRLYSTVTLSGPSESPVSFVYATVPGGTATSPADYFDLYGTYTVPAGATTGKFYVRVKGDSEVEPDEYLDIEITSPTNATINDGLGTGTILNDD